MLHIIQSPFVKVYFNASLLFCVHSIVCFLLCWQRLRVPSLPNRTSVFGTLGRMHLERMSQFLQSRACAGYFGKFKIVRKLNSWVSCNKGGNLFFTDPIKINWTLTLLNYPLLYLFEIVILFNFRLQRWNFSVALSFLQHLLGVSHWIWLTSILIWSVCIWSMAIS